MNLKAAFQKVRTFLGLGVAGKNAGGTGGWLSLGGQRTKTGQAVDERRAETLSAVHRATRVVTEALAQLPLELREYDPDGRTSHAAYSHRMYRIMHDRPNSELTKFQFFDLQVPLQMNWGDCYAEKQRDAVTNEVVALWPIHSSRVQIVRGPYRDNYGDVLGADGSLVYIVRNNSGSPVALEAADMLHVPGIMDPCTGYSGRSIVRQAAEVLGIALATQDHVAAFHRNGATPDIVVSFKGAIPPEDKKLLRESWATNYGGTDNAHKAIILSNDPTVTPVSINPKDALLIDGQRFGVEEVCRFWGVPPHLLYELGRATWSNIEDMGQDFVAFTLQAWICRWEGALNAQLLTEEEQQRYTFKFNIKGLLRGNSAARLAFYKGMFDMACISPDEIRELEDMNPIPDGMGDRYFLPGNNYVPLERIDDVGTINQSSATTPADAKAVTNVAGFIESTSEPTGHATLQAAAQSLLTTALEGLIQYETHKANLHGGKPNFDQWAEEFYAGAFRRTFDKAVGPVLDGAKAIGCTANLESFASAHIEYSKRELLHLYAANQDTPHQEFAARLSTMLSGWSGRAAAEATSAFATTTE